MPAPDPEQRAQRYARIREQLRELLVKTDDPVARMATVAAGLEAIVALMLSGEPLAR